MSVSLSVAAHTNVGKTTLVRTLVRRDIGEVADRPHVTESAERYTLAETPEGEALYLWDTPGFGDSARLARRLEASGNPWGWLQSQVWDRLADRPFFCSQRAIRHVREASDVVLYLVNAAEDPSASAYVDAELRILAWIGKPVLLLLNQVGAPRPREAEAAEEARWAARLASHGPARAVVTLDAFARCWVQEDRLLGAVAALLPAERQAEFGRLRAARLQRDLDTFGAAARALAGTLARTAADREPVAETLDPAALAQRVKHWWSRALDGTPREEPAVARAMESLGTRLQGRVREEIDRLITLHGLSGRAREPIVARTARAFDVSMPADVAGTGLLGGLLTGAAGGLAADLSTGGLSLGAGMIVGAVLGALGAGGAARAYNLLQGQDDGRVRWSADFLGEAARASLLRYLAVAHYGRGRGEWSEGEAPAHWAPIVEEAVAQRAAELQAAWGLSEQGVGEEAVTERIAPVLESALRQVLVRLYPDCHGTVIRFP